MDVLADLARYNSLTNDELGQLLSNLTEEQLNLKIGGFFESIIKTANHILLSDITWLRRIAQGVDDAAPLKSEIPDTVEFSFEVVPWPRLDHYLPVREKVDAQLERIVAIIPFAKRTVPFIYLRGNGEQRESLISSVLLHLFNHQTHHRGQISLMLDELGVKNDYSSLMSKI